MYFDRRSGTQLLHYHRSQLSIRLHPKFFLQVYCRQSQCWNILYDCPRCCQIQRAHRHRHLLLSRDVSRLTRWGSFLFRRVSLPQRDSFCFDWHGLHSAPWLLHAQPCSDHVLLGAGVSEEVPEIIVYIQECKALSVTRHSLFIFIYYSPCFWRV